MMITNLMCELLGYDVGVVIPRLPGAIAMMSSASSSSSA